MLTLSQKYYTVVTKYNLYTDSFPPPSEPNVLVSSEATNGSSPYLKHLSGGGHRRTPIKLPPPSDEQPRLPRAIRSPNDKQRRWRPSGSGDFGALGPRLGRRQGGKVGRWGGGKAARWGGGRRGGTRGASKASGALAILLLDKNQLLDKYPLLDKYRLLDKYLLLDKYS